MTKQAKSAMPGYYGTTRDASPTEIADAAMRAYGHPWHARATLLAHRAYLASIGQREPKETEGAIEILEERASGQVTVTEHSTVFRSAYTHTIDYDIAGTLDAWGAPFARSGTRDLCECEQAELDRWLFGGTLSKALSQIADALYAMQIVRVFTKSGVSHHAYLGEAERISRKHGKYAPKLTLRDEQGKELEDKHGNLKELSAANIARIDRTGTFERYPSEEVSE